MKPLLIYAQGPLGLGGKFGDTLWALAVAQEWARQRQEPVGLAIPNSEVREALRPLIQQQPYIGELIGGPILSDLSGAEVRLGDYRYFPDQPLAFYIAKMAGLEFMQQPARDHSWVNCRFQFPLCDQPYVAYGFNPMHPDTKDAFMTELTRLAPETVPLLDVSELGWVEAAKTIAGARAFVGCRSANYVLAHAVGQQQVIVFEPEAARRSAVFGCPWAPDTMVTGAGEAAAAIRKALTTAPPRVPRPGLARACNERGAEPYPL